MNPFWETERTAARPAVIDGIEIRKGSRVRLHPHPGGDIMDLALAGRVALVETIERDYEDRVYVAVTVEDDPGHDLGMSAGGAGWGQLGHRFFFALDEVEPLDDEWSKGP